MFFNQNIGNILDDYIDYISGYDIWSMTGSVALTSTADTYESEEEVLSVINASSKSSVAKMSAILSMMENKHESAAYDCAVIMLTSFCISSVFYHGYCCGMRTLTSQALLQTPPVNCALFAVETSACGWTWHWWHSAHKHFWKKININSKKTPVRKPNQHTFYWIEQSRMRS